MTARPILFSAPMIRALLSGRKTQTRRILKPQPNAESVASGDYQRQINDLVRPSPIRFDVGDRLWVREAHYLTDDGHYERAVYAADEDAVREHNKTMERLAGRIDEKVWRRHVKLRPSIHMPRWASRLTLTVTDVRVQRLQDISEEDAIAEGISVGKPMAEVPGSRGDIYHDGVTDPIDGWTRDPVEAYRHLWEYINGAGSWDANPFVAAYTFEVERRNIDAPATAAKTGGA